MGLTPASGLPRPRARASGRLSCRKKVCHSEGGSYRVNRATATAMATAWLPWVAAATWGCFGVTEKPKHQEFCRLYKSRASFLCGNRRRLGAAVTIQIWVSGAGGPASVGCTKNGVQSTWTNTHLPRRFLPHGCQPRGCHANEYYTRCGDMIVSNLSWRPLPTPHRPSQVTATMACK